MTIDSSPSTVAIPGNDWVADVLSQASGVRIGGVVVTEGLERRALLSPADNTAIAEVGYGDAGHAAAALRAAQKALPGWSATPVADRASALRRIAAALADAGNHEQWAGLITSETGKRMPEAVAELKLSAVYFSTFADLLGSQSTEEFRAVPGFTHRVSPRPLGVVAVLTPWNFPVSIPARKIAPLLAAGCTAVFKPSELAPLSSMVLARLLDEHLPAGVVNTVLGDPADVADPWLAAEQVRAVSFTGSTRVGRLVAAAVSDRFLRTVMELGGCAPFVVLDDADVEHAVDTLMIAKFRNNGQSCIAANQVFLARSISEEFLSLLTTKTARLTIGDPREAETDLGPLAPSQDPARISALVEQAIREGGEALVPSQAVPHPGNYVSPQFVRNVPVESALFTEEVFGPAAGIHVFDDVEEALALHHATGFGLAGYVCGSDVDRARAVAERLRAGVIGINNATPNYPGAPFGGLGLSGMGYEGGLKGLEAFQSFHTVAEVGE